MNKELIALKIRQVPYQTADDRTNTGLGLKTPPMLKKNCQIQSNTNIYLLQRCLE